MKSKITLASININDLENNRKGCILINNLYENDCI